MREYGPGLLWQTGFFAFGDVCSISSWKSSQGEHNLQFLSATLLLEGCRERLLDSTVNHSQWQTCRYVLSLSRVPEDR